MLSPSMNSRVFSFVGGTTGSWRVARVVTVAGEALAPATRLSIVDGLVRVVPADARWMVRGTTSNDRYVTRPENRDLVARQPVLGRPEAVCAALIPIRKNAAWWSLTQDERRSIFEEQSRHIQTGLRFLPAVARRLHHCRDLGEPEPFDFLTWFEFAPASIAPFDDLVGALRASPEWRFVDREVDIRLEREA
jgi:hypothetical protein